MAKRIDVAALSPAPEPSERDRAATARASARVIARPKRASVRLQGGDLRAASIAAPHSDANGHGYQMLDAFGTASHPFMAVTLGQLLDTLTAPDTSVPQ